MFITKEFAISKGYYHPFDIKTINLIWLVFKPLNVVFLFIVNAKRAMFLTRIKKTCMFMQYVIVFGWPREDACLRNKVTVIFKLIKWIFKNKSFAKIIQNTK